MRPDSSDQCSFDVIIREAWRIAGAEGAPPLTGNGFRERLTDMVESALAESYFLEMRAMRDRLDEVSRHVADSVVEQGETLCRGQLEALALVGRSAAVNSVRLSAAMTLDLIEGRVRR
jgi:hypothetical protein